MSRPQTVAVTGATGYVGSTIAAKLQENGQSVIALSRNADVVDPKLSYRKFDLQKEFPEKLLEGVDVLIHAAWNLGSGDANVAWQENVVGSRRLFNCAKASGVNKVIFISSMSAYEGTRQTYGLMKLAVERTAQDSGYVIVRPGLVYATDARGMAGTLTKISALPVWPSFRRSRLYLVHRDDLTSAMTYLCAHVDDFAG